VIYAAVEAAAITVVFVKGSIFRWPREHGPQFWREFSGCALCVGFWVGMSWAILRGIGAPMDPLDVFAAAAMAAVLALLVVRALDALDAVD
jgi:hypothetical protein